MWVSIQPTSAATFAVRSVMPSTAVVATSTISSWPESIAAVARSASLRSAALATAPGPILIVTRWVPRSSALTTWFATDGSW